MWIHDSPSDDPITILVDGEHKSDEKTTCNKNETLRNKWKVCLKFKAFSKNTNDTTHPIASMYSIFTYTFTIQINHSM